MDQPEVKSPTLRDEDAEFPSLAVMAGRNAYERALHAGQKVLIAEGGVLYEVSPEGGRRVIKQLPPMIPVQKGRVLKLW